MNVQMVNHELNPWVMFLEAGTVVKVVMIVLVLASLATWTILVSKVWELYRVNKKLTNTRILIDRNSILSNLNIVENKNVLSCFLEVVQQEMKYLKEGDNIKQVKKNIISRLDILELEFFRRLLKGIGILASIGAISPFVGLFGTVWGIMNSFIGITKSNTTNLAIVAPGIAEALLATGLGLMAAIPAVLIYNFFSRRIAELRVDVNIISKSLVNIASKNIDDSMIK